VKSITRYLHRFNWLPAILLAAVVVLIAGCASVPESSLEMKQQALSFTTPPDMAGIYIIRPYNFVGSAGLWNISLDNQNFGTLKTRSYIYNPVWPGEHSLSMPAVGDNDGTPLITQAGHNYFMTVKPGLTGAKFTLLSETDGEAYVKKYTLSGDNFYKPPFIPETVDSATPVACRVVLAQNDPFVTAKVIHLGTGVPVTGGLIDIGVSLTMDLAIAEGHKVANKERADRAAKMTASLKGYGLGGFFRTNIESLLSSTLPSSPWLHTMQLEMTNRPVTLAEIYQHPAIQINLAYYLSYDASALIMQAHLLYFRQGETNATYARYYTYYSEPVGPEQYEDAVAKWTASNGALFRRRMTEGMNEINAMIDLDFCHRKPMDPMNRTVKISIYDDLTLNQEKWKGFILRNENPRVIFQDRNGNLFSIIPGEDPFTALHTKIEQTKQP
jgi:Protein of unknown function (DUF2846)